MNDKLLHFVAGAVVVLLSAPFVDPAWATMLGILSGAVKEIYDYLHNLYNKRRGLAPVHTFDAWDFAWTVWGAGLATVGVVWYVGV